MESKCGIKLADNSAFATLDIRQINVQATGLWQCKLYDGDSPVSGMEATYEVKVARYPGFGKYEQKRYRGKPPQLVYAVDGSSVKISCTVTSYDQRSAAIKPVFSVEGIPVSSLCSSTHTTPKNPVICSSMFQNILTREIPVMDEKLAKFTKTMEYTVKNLIYRDKTTSKSMSHMLSCSATGQYPSYPSGSGSVTISAKTLTSVNVIPRPTAAVFAVTPKNCSSQSTSKTACKATNDNVFKCKLKMSYETAVSQLGVKIRKLWKVT